MTITATARIAASIAAAAITLGATVAFADPITAPAKPAPSAATRYCVVSEIGGSRFFTRRTCKTRDAWIKDEAFDPAKAQR